LVCCRYAWRHQLEALGSTGQYYCVAVDMRGFGESDKPAGVENYRIEFIVQDIVSIVRTLGYDTVVSAQWPFRLFRLQRGPGRVPGIGP
jgi:pimeloyl-ACP methyl ester carboxylesterase